MAFKMITDSEKAAGRIAGEAKAHAERIAAEQVAKWKDRLPAGQEDVGIGQMQRFYSAKLRRLCRVMYEKESEHLDQLAVIRALRVRRNEAASELRDKLYRIRDLVEGKYGEGGPRALFLEEPSAPVDPTPLARVGSIVVKSLVDPELELPKPIIIKGADLEFSDLAGEVSRPLATMAAALLELEDELPQANATLEAKKWAHAAVDDLTRRLTRFLEGLYGLEEHDDLMIEVRSSSRWPMEESATAEEGEEGARASAGHVEDGRKMTALLRLAPRVEDAGGSEMAASPPPAVAKVVPLMPPEGARAAGGIPRPGRPRPGRRSSADSAAAGQEKASRVVSGSEMVSEDKAGAATSGKAPSAGAAGEGTSQAGGRQAAPGRDGEGPDPTASATPAARRPRRPPDKPPRR